MDELLEFLLERRDVDKAQLIPNAIETHGYFDVEMYSKGTEQAFTIGQETAEAELIERILRIIKYK